MSDYTLNYEAAKDEKLPSVSLDLNESITTAIYSDTDLQAELIEAILREGKMSFRSTGRTLRPFNRS